MASVLLGQDASVCDSEHFHSVATFPCFWAGRVDGGRKEGRKECGGFYEEKEKENQVSIRISQVSGRKRKER